MILENVDALIISDVHQDLGFISKALEAEKGKFEYLIFNGDWFDTYSSVWGAEAMCEYVNNLLDEYGDKLVMNYGNHDLPYYYSFLRGQVCIDLAKNYYCSGYSLSSGQAIIDTLSAEVVERTRFCLMVNGYLISHAGVLPELITPSESDSIVNFIYKCNETDILVDTSSSIFNVGSARGGFDRYSGLLWCDWDDEFKSSLGVPQIVGHTYNPNPSIKKGDSYNIDGGQSCYAILTPHSFIIKEV